MYKSSNCNQAKGDFPLTVFRPFFNAFEAASHPKAAVHADNVSSTTSKEGFVSDFGSLTASSSGCSHILSTFFHCASALADDGSEGAAACQEVAENVVELGSCGWSAVMSRTAAEAASYGRILSGEITGGGAENEAPTRRGVVPLSLESRSWTLLSPLATEESSAMDMSDHSSHFVV